MDIEEAIDVLTYDRVGRRHLAAEALIAAYRAQEQEIAAARRLLGEVLDRVKGAMSVLDGGDDASR